MTAGPDEVTPTNDDATGYAANAVERLPDRLPQTLYDVAMQYATFDWYGTVTGGGIDWPIDPDHLGALTPTAKQQLFGEPESLIVVHVDLTDPESPRLADDPVSIEEMTADMRYRVGHSYPDGRTSNMTDYSITTYKSADAHHLAGYREDAYWTNNVRDRFSEWAQSDAADRVLEEYDGDDAYVLRALASIGDDEPELDRLSEAFIREASDEERSFDALITVAIRTRDEDGGEHVRYPGEIDVLNEVMLTRRMDRMLTVNVADGSSGVAADYGTGDETTVYGGTPGLFGQYAKQQREHFPNLSPDGSDAWRTLSVSRDTANAIATASTVFEAFYRALGAGRRIYILPYLAARREDITTDEVEWFHRRVFSRLRDADQGDIETVVEDMYRELLESGGDAEPAVESPLTTPTPTGYWEDVRFAMVFFVSGNPDRVYFTSLDATYPPAILADAHARVVMSGPLAPGGIFRQLPDADSAFLLDPEASLHRRILFGGYWDITTEPERDSRQSSDEPEIGTTDDTRLQNIQRLLSGERIPAATLLEQYIHDLVQTQKEQAGDDDEFHAWIGAPVLGVVEQYAQLHALAEADLLTAGGHRFEQFTDLLTSDATSPTTETETERNPMTDPDTHANGDETETENEAEKTRDELLEEFIAEHRMLDDPRHKSVFLLGGLVGRLSMYQRSKNISSTLINRYPIDYIDQRTLVEVVKDVLQMNNSYIEADPRASSSMNARYTTPLPDVMLKTAPPSEWDVPTDVLQWVYALGISYGVADTSSDDYTDDDDTEGDDSDGDGGDNGDADETLEQFAN